MTDSGFVTLIGAGPGDPELLTRKGLRAIRKAEVILYDALLDPSFLNLFPETATTVYVGKRAGQHSRTQTEINSLLVEYAKSGKRVARLKGGDSFLFGRGGEEILALRANGIEYEVIPGVSSVMSGSSENSFPLTHRGVSRQLLVMDAHTLLTGEEDWKWLRGYKGTLAILMGSKSSGTIAQTLLQLGFSPNLPIALSEASSLVNSDYHQSTLAEISGIGFSKKTKGPGILYVGKVLHFSSYASEKSLEEIA